LGFKNQCRARVGFGLMISGLGRVRASKRGQFTSLRWRIDDAMLFQSCLTKKLKLLPTEVLWS